ncbi:MAG TPA: T9SS type A sorting domain-containing protein [Bacteroidia bacterium]|nr:T9SS type A sorting domain-containing protein [Bacteroidia bacterium]
MKNTITLCMLLCFSNIQAQVPTWQWTKSATCANSNGLGEGTDIATDVWGNAFVTGYFKDSSITFGAFTLYPSITTNINTSIFVAKYDSSGTVLWARNATGVTSSAVNDIKTDMDGNVYLTGYFSGGFMAFGSDTIFGQAQPVMQQVFIVKFDSSGTFLWANSSSGVTAYGTGLACDTNGNVFVTGYFYSNNPVTFGNDSLTSEGGIDIFIVKYDAAGNVIWAKSAGGTSSDYVFSIGYNTATNTFAITGSFRSAIIIFGTDTLFNNNPSSYDIYVAKFDASGNHIWASRAGGFGNEEGRCVINQGTDFTYVCGKFQSQQIWFDSYNFYLVAGVPNSFIAKYDSVGSVVWAVPISGGNTLNIDMDVDFGIYVNGQMDAAMSIDSVSLPYPAGIDPLFIAKYDSAGHTLFALSMSSGGDDYSGMAIGPNGSVYIGGDFVTNPFIVGNDTLQLTGNEDVFVAKLGYGTGVGMAEYANRDRLRVFPNPSSGEITLLLNGDYSRVSILNINGQTVYEKQVRQLQQLQVHIDHPGIYLVKAVGDKGVQYKTIAVTE